MTDKPKTGIAGKGKKKPDKELNEPAFRYYMDVLRRRVWIIGTIFTVIFVFGTIKTFRSPRIYQAVAKIIVDREVPRLINLEGVQTDLRGWDPEFYKTKADLVSSRDVLEMAVQDSAVSNMLTQTAEAYESESFVGEIRRTFLSLLGGQPPPPPEPWQRLASHVSAEHVEDTHFVLVKVEDTDPAKTAVMADAVSAAYERYHYIQQQKMHGDTFEFLEREKDKVEKLLAGAERDLQDFRASTEEISPAGENAEQPVIKRLNELNDRLTETQLTRVDLSSQLKVIKQLFNSDQDADKKAESLFTIPAIKEDPQVQSLHTQIREAETELDKLSGLYGTAHPLLKSTEQKIVALRRDSRDAIETRVKTVANNLKALEEKEAALQKQYEKEKKNALEYAQESFQYTRLRGEVERYQRLFDTLVEKMSQVDMSAGYLKVNVKVVERPSVPTVPIRPNKKRGVTLFAMLGLMLGLGVAFVVEDLDDVIKTPEDLKLRLGLPVIGFVPKIEEEEDRVEEMQPGPVIKKRVLEDNGDGEFAPPVQRPIVASDDKIIPARVSLMKSTSSVAEAYRHIRTNLFYSIPAGEKKVIGFVSASPAEGKTTTSSNVALTIALSGRKVLLMDADFHRPMINRVHGLKNRIGLSSVLVGEATIDEAILHIEHDGRIVGDLDIVPAGPQSPNPAELLGSRKMEELMAGLHERYDWIIVDTPPILYVSDAVIVSTLCDGIIIVVKAGKNNRSMLNRAIEQLTSVNVDIVGGILNMVQISRLGRHYSSYYYHGYSKYVKDYHYSYYQANADGADGTEG